MASERNLRTTDGYMDSLHKLLPAEITAVYMVLRAGASENPDLTSYLLLFSALLAIVFYFVAPFLIGITAHFERLFYCTTFAIWVISLDADIIASDLFIFTSEARTVFLYIVSSISVLWSFLVPYLLLIYKKRREPKGQKI